ncbi:hypothetical protein [Micromonospora craniellae]|uniref:Uncharacterized protein n=1 Tax=Micromonospora craniellae TaxID=2294034 RepID=A0A372FSG8_9ACTN|nr:hypothetical protein [Micromonospora craniellae]QOC91594.1 hypothetical protein ID554_27220 [Micromonospora craniellae]RFS43526.1 hypothetical protein D0Q02_27230 [Micromonospora craniellae]
MRRTRLRLALFALPALVGGVLMAAASPVPVGAVPADPGGPADTLRSHLDAHDQVSHVRVQLSGADMVDKVVAAGFDLEHGLTRVPDGIEGEVAVTAEQRVALEAMGVKILADDEGFEWSDEADGGLPASAARTLAAAGHDNTVRIARADWFTTKGQGFLYVEARTTEGSQTAPIVGMHVENDSGKGTEFAFARTMSRFVDSGQYMFHRNLFKLDTVRTGSR